MRWLFVSSGIVAFTDPRSSAADPPRPGLGASGGDAARGSGGLLPQQVNKTLRFVFVAIHEVLGFVVISDSCEAKRREAQSGTTDC